MNGRVGGVETGQRFGAAPAGACARTAGAGGRRARRQRPQQPAAGVRGGAAAELVGDRGGGDGGVAGLQAARRIRACSARSTGRPAVGTCGPQRRPRAARHGPPAVGVGGGELGHARSGHRRAGPAAPPSVPHQAGDLVEGAPGDAERHRRQRGQQHGIDREPPHRPRRPGPVGERAAPIERDDDVVALTWWLPVPAGQRSPRCPRPRVLDRDEHDPLASRQPVDERSEPDPLAVQAVARERPTPGEQVPVTVAGERPVGANIVALPWSGSAKIDLRRVLGQVAGEQVAAGADDRAPAVLPSAAASRSNTSIATVTGASMPPSRVARQAGGRPSPAAPRPRRRADGVPARSPRPLRPRRSTISLTSSVGPAVGWTGSVCDVTMASVFSLPAGVTSNW